MSEDTDSEEEDCSKIEECKNPSPKKISKEEPEEKDYNSEEDSNFNDANFMNSMKEGKYRDKHFRRFSKQNDGIEFTAFDLREENEEGHFDKNMNYIPNKEEYDPWYESVKDEIRQKELLKHKRKKNEKDSDGETGCKIKDFFQKEKMKKKKRIIIWIQILKNLLNKESELNETGYNIIEINESEILGNQIKKRFYIEY